MFLERGTSEKGAAMERKLFSKSGYSKKVTL